MTVPATSRAFELVDLNVRHVILQKVLPCSLLGPGNLLPDLFNRCGWQVRGRVALFFRYVRIIRLTGTRPRGRPGASRVCVALLDGVEICQKSAHDFRSFVRYRFRRVLRVKEQRVATPAMLLIADRQHQASFRIRLMARLAVPGQIDRLPVFSRQTWFQMERMVEPNLSGVLPARGFAGPLEIFQQFGNVRHHVIGACARLTRRRSQSSLQGKVGVGDCGRALLKPLNSIHSGDRTGMHRSQILVTLHAVLVGDSRKHILVVVLAVAGRAGDSMVRVEWIRRRRFLPCQDEVRRSVMAGNAFLFSDRRHGVVQACQPLQDGPFGVALGAVVFEHAMRPGHPAAVVNPLLTLECGVCQPDRRGQAADERDDPRRPAKPIHMLLRIDFDAFRKFAARAQQSHGNPHQSKRDHAQGSHDMGRK